MYSSFLIKYGIIREFTENNIVLFVPYRHKALSHIMSPRTVHLCERYGLWSGFGVSPKYTKEKEIGRYRS